jgi:hypothetical protein
VTIPYGADYDDDGNLIETAVEAYDRVHGDPEVPWPVVGPETAGDRAFPELSPQESAFDLGEQQPGDTGDSRDTGKARLARTHWSARELMAAEFPEPRWAVPGLIAEGATLLAGAPKAGKSWFALDLAVAAASGGQALGRVNVKAGPVLYLALEDTGRRLQARLAKVLGPDDAPEGLILATRCKPLPLGGDADISVWLKHHHGAQLVIIDVLARVRGPSSRDIPPYEADYHALARAKAIADEHGVPFVVVHHTRKAAGEDFIDTISGTHGLAAAADSILVLKRIRGKADAILHVTGRDVEEASYALRFAADIGAWQLLDVPAAEVTVGDTRAKILAYVRQHEGSAPKEIAYATGLDYGLTKKTCRRMADDAQLDTDGHGAYFLPVASVSYGSGVPAVPPVPDAGQSNGPDESRGML